MDRRELLQYALEGIQHKRGELADLAAGIYAELNPPEAPKRVGRPAKIAEVKASRKYKRSAATRRRMSEVQKARHLATTKKVA